MMGKRKTKKSLLNEILSERAESAKAEKLLLEQELVKMHSKPVLVRNDEAIACLNHGVGYFTAVVYEIELILQLLELSETSIRIYIKERTEAERENERYLENLFRNITEEE